MSVASSLTRVFVLALLTVLTLTGICVYRTFVVFKVTPVEGECKQSDSHQPITDVDNLIARFSRAIQFRTVTAGPKQVDEVELLRFINWLETAYPTFHKSKLVQYERVANFSLLYTIQGSNRDLKPYMLCSHLDVVPVELDKWTVEPFAGIVKDEYIYGRGTIDVKDTLMAIFEAFEHLFKNEDFVPERGVILAFGHDEEGSGIIGAHEMSQILQKRQVRPEFILDEGTFISEQTFPGVNNLIAFIGIAEKGYLTIELKSKGQAGHSSMPPKNSVIVQLAKAAAKFDADALPSMFGKGPEVVLIESLAAYARFPFNIMYSNLWLFGPVINHFFGTSVMGNSLIRTTSVPTIIRAGFKDNILPSEATVTINHRIHPSQSIAQVLQFDRQLIDNDDIDISVVHEFEPHPYSPYDDQSFGYQNIKRAVRQVFTDKTVVVPGIMIASTDTKHYLPLTDNIYRFSPVIMNSTEIKRFHGHDERIQIANYVKIVNFYHHLIRASDRTQLERTAAREEL